VSGGAGTAGATAGRTPTQNARVGYCLLVSGGRCELGIAETSCDVTVTMFSVASEARVADAGMSCRQGDTRGVVMTTVARQRAEIRVCYTHKAQIH